MALGGHHHDEEAGLVTGKFSSCIKPKYWSKICLASMSVAFIISAIYWYSLAGGSSIKSIRKGSTMVSRNLHDNPLQFAVVGDWGRKGAYNQSLIAAEMNKIGKGQKFSFIISTGDNFYENGLFGVDDPLFEESFSKIYTGDNLQVPWFSVLGNHDYHGDVLAQLNVALALRDSRWHCGREYQLTQRLDSLDQGGSYLEFFFIDTVPFVNEYWQNYHKHMDGRGILPREEHLTQKLQALSQALASSLATWKIVVGHHPIYSEGSHGDTIELVEKVLPILNAHGVDLYVNGHDHCLEYIKRVDSSLNFITTGGGSKAWKGIKPPSNKNGLKLYYDGQGFTTFTVTSTQLHISYYDLEGNVIYEVDLYKKPKLSSTEKEATVPRYMG